MNKFESSPVTKAFKKQFRSLPSSVKLHFITGVSGGPDSMVLLYLLHRFKADAFVVHCNYALRGADSDKDQELVEGMSSYWGFDCISVRLEPDERSENNFQKWARDTRYTVFYDMMEETGASHIATAHHLDDQIETIMQKVLRGSGISAWNGMGAIDKELFRPLLHVSKQEILEFAESMNIPYRIDSSNEESTYARNFLRNNWFPGLDKLFPGWRDNILQLPRRAEEFTVLTDHLAGEMIAGDNKFFRDKFLSVDSKLHSLLLKSIVEKFNPDIQLSRKFLNSISDLKLLQTGKYIDISDNYRLMRSRDFFVLTEGQGRAGEDEVTILKSEAENGISVGSVKIRISEKLPDYDDNLLAIDADRLSFPLSYRSWKNGDRFKPFGMKGSQLVSDHLTNRKIPAHLKSGSKVLISFDGKICAVIFPDSGFNKQIGTISESVRCIEDTKKTLIIENLNINMGLYQPDTVNINGDRFRVYLTQEEIHQRIKQLGESISKDFKDKRPIFIGVLNGAYIFLADLMRYVDIPCEVDFLKLSSYGDEKVSSGQVQDLKEIDADVSGRHIIFVEDIVDTGLSMKYLVQKISAYNPASITVVTLLHKTEATNHDVQIDYTGFKIPNLFVIGYGLDYAQEGRNLAQIYILDESVS